MWKNAVFLVKLEKKEKEKAMHDAWQLIVILYTINYLEVCRRIPWLFLYLFGILLLILLAFRLPVSFGYSISWAI
jgi:hypothetical protein